MHVDIIVRNYPPAQNGDILKESNFVQVIFGNLCKLVITKTFYLLKMVLFLPNGKIKVRLDANFH